MSNTVKNGFSALSACFPLPGTRPSTNVSVCKPRRKPKRDSTGTLTQGTAPGNSKQDHRTQEGSTQARESHKYCFTSQEAVACWSPPQQAAQSSSAPRVPKMDALEWTYTGWIQVMNEQSWWATTKAHCRFKTMMSSYVSHFIQLLLPPVRIKSKSHLWKPYHLPTELFPNTPGV